MWLCSDPSDRLLSQRRPCGSVLQLGVLFDVILLRHTVALLAIDLLEFGLNEATVSPHTMSQWVSSSVQRLLVLTASVCSSTLQLHTSNGALLSCALGIVLFWVASRRVKTHCCVRSCSHWDASVQSWFQYILHFMWLVTVQATKEPVFNLDGLKVKKIFADS